MADNNILLINPANPKTEIWAPPIGLAYLASYARKFFPEYNYKIFDFWVAKMSLQKQIELIKKEKPWIIGMTAMTANISSAYKLAHFIKKALPKTRIILGGAHISGIKKLNSPDIDTAVLGEGEQAFVDLIKMYKSNQTKKNIPKIYSAQLLKNIDLIPAWDLIDFSQYKWFQPSRNREQAVVYWSRGCPFNCVFCANSVWRYQIPRVRFRTPDNIVEELKLLQENYGIKEVYVLDDELNTNPNWLYEVCKTIIKHKIKINWKCLMRANRNLVSAELLSIMKKAGCWQIAWGLESGDNNVLKNIKKCITVEDIWNSLRLAKDKGIISQGLFMLGNIWYNSQGKPSGETYQDCLKTIELAKNLRDKKLLDYIQFNIATPYPGSEMWEIVQKFGLSNKAYQKEWEKWDMDYHNLSFNHPTLKKNELLKLHQKAWIAFSFSPRLLLSHLSRIRSFDDLKSFFASVGVVLNIVLTGHPRKRK